MTTEQPINHLPEDVVGIAESMDRLAQLDSVAPEAMQARVAAAAMSAARSEAPIAGRIHAAHASPERRSRVTGRQWAMAATVLIGFGVGFSVLSRLSQPTPTVIDSTADAALAQEDMERWLTLTEATDETFTSAVKQLTTDTSRVSESVISPPTISLDGDSL